MLRVKILKPVIGQSWLMPGKQMYFQGCFYYNLPTTRCCLTLVLPETHKITADNPKTLRKALRENATHLDDIDDVTEEGFSLSVNGVADFLSMRGAKPTVVLLSPSGDDGSTATVMLARSIAELGRSIVLVDMTSSGCPTRLMAPEPGLPGVADLLFGEVTFGETIHHDRLSNAHIVPQGSAQALYAVGIIERLSMVLGALADTYDTVLLEFGASDIEGVTRLLKYVDAEIVVSLPDADDAVFVHTLSELRALGYADVVTMGGPQPGDRSAA